jgi:acetate kinase
MNHGSHSIRSMRDLPPSNYRFTLSRKGNEDRVNLVLTSTVSSISSPPAKFSFGNDVTNEPVDSIQDHASAFEHFLEKLQLKASIDSTRIKYICHRIVHGGDYTQPVEINHQSYHHIEQLSDLAPL